MSSASLKGCRGHFTRAVNFANGQSVTLARIQIPAFHIGHIESVIDNMKHTYQVVPTALELLHDLDLSYDSKYLTDLEDVAICNTVGISKLMEAPNATISQVRAHQRLQICQPQPQPHSAQGHGNGTLKPILLIRELILQEIWTWCKQLGAWHSTCNPNTLTLSKGPQI